MPSLSSRPRLLLACVFVAVAAGLGWLMFGLAGDHTGMRRLPDPAAGWTVDTLADAGRNLTIDEVAARPAKSWTRWDGDYIRAGGHDPVWVRVKLRNASADFVHGLLVEPEYFTDHVDFWERTTDGWRQLHAGEAVSIRDKPIWGRGEAFPVDLPPGAEKTLYLRLDDRFAIWAHVVWWPRVDDYLAAQVRDVLAEGICYGGLLALLLYNATLWLRLRHADTGYYVLYAAAMLSANTVSNNGTALLGFTIGSPWKEMISIGSLTCSTMFLVQFGRTFLEAEKRMPRLDRLARGARNAFIGFTGIALLVPLLPTVDWVYFVVPLAAMTHVLLLVMAVTSWRAGLGHARFFILAFGAVFMGGLPSVLMWVNHLVTKKTAMGVVLGSTLEILLLALAIADRFARLQREKAEAQERLVEESEQRRAIQEAYADELEVEVRERTHELETANADKDRMITVLGHDLRGPLTGLTQSAEQVIRARDRAELEEFAADAGRTGRLLLLLIEDLVLWARLRAGTMHVTRHAVAAWVTPAVAMHRRLADRGGVELAAIVSPDLHIETDLVLAQALVRNLVSNAVKYAQHRVEVVAEPTDAGIQLSVRDDGPGLPPEVVASLRADTYMRPAADGSRLGLRFCHEISRALGARLAVTCPAEGGTHFSLTFRAAKPEAVTV